MQSSGKYVWDSASSAWVKAKGSSSGVPLVSMDSEDTSNNVVNVENGPYEYEACAANATTTLGATGAAGDFLHTLSVRFNDAAGNASFSLKDNGVTVFSVSAADNTNGPAMSTLTYNLDCVSKNGAWSVVCASGVSAFATGRFTA